MEKDEVVQAVVVADLFNNSFYPLLADTPVALFPLVGVPAIDFVLDALAQSGVEETILFCCHHLKSIKEHIADSIKRKVTWSLCMEVQVLSSESCRTMGDVMRELDASALIRGHFILAGINSIFNVQLLPLFDQHKQTCKKDKGVTMTLLYKKVTYGHDLFTPDAALFLATDARSKRVLIHQKFKNKSSNETLDLPLEIILNHSEIELHYDLVDTNIAFCSPSVLPLFTDNFDFQTKDDFIKGILMNEEVLSSTLYYLPLSQNEYGAAITNWHNYQLICRDILHNWVYPRTKEIWHIGNRNKYIFGGNHIYRSSTANLSTSSTLDEDVFIDENTVVGDNSFITKSLIGSDCNIGKNVTIKNSHILSGVSISDNVEISDSFIAQNCCIKENCKISSGSIISVGVTIQSGANLENETVVNDEINKRKGSSRSESSDWDNESVRSDVEEICLGFQKVPYSDESVYSSASSEDLSIPPTPEQDDAKIFLNEVIDSLARGYEQKLECDCLILEINSSRFAYDIQLHEVNYFVIQAMLSLPIVCEAKNVMNTIKAVFKFFKPVISNYIKTKESIMDCLKAVEDSSSKNPWLQNKCGLILYILYEDDVIADEQCFATWYKDMVKRDSQVRKETSVVKFFEWLNKSDSEESDED